MSRYWNHRVLGETEMHIRDTLLRAVNLKPQRGNRVMLDFNFDTLFQTLTGISIPQGENGTFSAASFKTLLETLGVDFSRNLTFNASDITRAFNIQLPKIIEDNLGTVSVPIEDLFNFLVANSNTPLDFGAEHIGKIYVNKLTVKVVDEFSWPEGKFSAALGNVVLIDSNYIGRVIRNILMQNPSIAIILENSGILPDLEESLSNFKLSVCWIDIH